MEWVNASLMTWAEFEEKGLNKVGTLVRIQFADPEGKKKVEKFLIGNINKVGGVCDDCMAFSRHAKVVEYKLVYEEQVP